jgi:hypothetical protein
MRQAKKSTKASRERNPQVHKGRQGTGNDSHKSRQR